MNLLYINTHDTGIMISPYGFNIPTDSLQELAAQSALFTNAFCASPTCSPSRASLLTGLYPHQNGMLGLAQRGFELKDNEFHLANHLRKHGFKTCISGIQHEYGWYLNKDEEGLHALGYDEVLTTDSTQYRREDLHLWDHENAKQIVNWLKSETHDKPFMISYGLHSTHRPYPIEILDNLDERYLHPAPGIINNQANRNDQAQYMTTAYYADQNIKLVIDALKENGLADDTIVLFTTDHGLALPFHKCNVTDSGIHVSLMLKIPNSSSNGKVFDQLVSQLDIFPTICDCLKIEKPTHLMGKSILPVLINNEDINEAIFAEVNFHTSYEPMRCVRTNRYKYIRYYDETWNVVNCSNIDESNPKDFLMNHGLQTHQKPKEALYDLYYDSGEQHNCIDEVEYQEVKARLTDILVKKQIETNDPILKGELEFKSSYKVNKKSCLQASSKDQNDYI